MARDLIGQQLSNYQLVSLLGRGDFSEVYLGQHADPPMQAAVKVLHVHLSAQKIDEFQQEAKKIIKLVHPHIISVLDFGMSKDTPYLIMDYCPNGTLRQRHPKGTRVPLPAVVTYVKQIADALQYAHSQQHIHHNIKPENIFIGRHDDILLSDFGIEAIAHNTFFNSKQAFVGTPPYMSPEQIKLYQRRESDQYALAIVTYEWLAGKLPFLGTPEEIANKHLSAQPPSLLQRLPALPASVEEVVFKALAKDSKERFPSVENFAAALEEASQIKQLISVPPQSNATQSQQTQSSASTTHTSQSATSTQIPTEAIGTSEIQPPTTISALTNVHNHVEDPNLVPSAPTTETNAHVEAQPAVSSTAVDNTPAQVPDPAPTSDSAEANSHTEPRLAAVPSTPDTPTQASDSSLTANTHVDSQTTISDTVSPSAVTPTADTSTIVQDSDVSSAIVDDHIKAPAAPQPIVSNFETQSAVTIPTSENSDTTQDVDVPSTMIPSDPNVSTTVPSMLDSSLLDTPIPLENTDTSTHTFDIYPYTHSDSQSVPFPVSATNSITQDFGVSPTTITYDSNASTAAPSTLASSLLETPIPPENTDTSTTTTNAAPHIEASKIIPSVTKHVLTPQPKITRRQFIAGLAATGIVVAAGEAIIWEVATSRSTSPSSSPQLRYTYTGHTWTVYTVAWSSDGQRIASGASDSTVQVWNATDGSNAFTYQGHTDTVYSTVWSPDGQRIASASADKTVQVWNATDGSNAFTYQGHSDTVYSVAWSLDGKRIASASADKTVQVWNVADGGNVFTYRVHPDQVYAVAWSPDSQQIASGGRDETVQVWDATNGVNLYSYRGHSDAVNSLAWSPDGKHIASGSHDRTVCVWAPVIGSSAYTYQGHSSVVNAIAWSFDGKRIASASNDKTVQVWDATNGSNAYTYRGQTNIVEAVGWSPNDQQIVSGSWDGTVQIWQAP